MDSTGKSTINYYQLLEVDQRARSEVIQKAYHELMKVYMPNGLANAGDEDIARRLNQAYEIISDKDKRQEYDKQLAESSDTKGVIGNYKIEKFIAQGAVGRTYLAEHMILKEKVCIKQCLQISAVAEEVLVEEAKNVWDLRHYALPAMRDLIRCKDGSVALVMSYIPGPTLLEIIEKVGKLEAEHVAWIAERVLNALSYMHHHGVVHGDIKPNNIIVQPEKHMAVLVDFGLGMKNPTSKSVSKGYTEYFAPPEARTDLPPIPQSDLYSLGITMLYALTGDLDAASNRRIPSNVPGPIQEFIQKLVRQSPLARACWIDQNGKGEDLCQSIKNVRTESFGRTSSGLKKIPGF